jgi:hypothetical protein
MNRSAALPLDERRPPYAALVFTTLLFTFAGLALVTWLLASSIEPLRAAAQAMKNAKAAVGQGVVPNVPPIDTTMAWTVFAIVASSSGLLLWISWIALRDSQRKSVAKTSSTVLTTIAFTMAGMVITFMKAKDLPPQLSSFFWPVFLSVAAIPFPAVYVLTSCFASRLNRGMEAIEHRPVRFSDLPAVTQRFFERHTPDMEALGFRHIGDYALKRHTPFFCRVFLGEDDRTFGELSTQRLLWLSTMKCCSFATIFESGDYLETANIASKTHDVGHYHTRSVPTHDMAKLYAAHEDAVAELSVQNETYPACCEPEDYSKISIYGHKLMYDRLVEEGVAARNIYDNAEPALA